MIGEVMMANRKVCEATDRTFQDILENEVKLLSSLVTADRFFLSSGMVVEQISLNMPQEFSTVKSVTLIKPTTNMRVKLCGGDFADFASTLLQIGEGRHPTEKHLGDFST